MLCISKNLIGGTGSPREPLRNIPAPEWGFVACFATWRLLSMRATSHRLAAAEDTAAKNCLREHRGLQQRKIACGSRVHGKKCLRQHGYAAAKIACGSRE